MDAHLREVFFALHSGLPREGPGDAASTARALALCPELPERPWILDLGCGPGAQTLELARRTRGTVVAVDNHAPYLDELRRRAAAAGLAERIEAVEGDMAAPPFPPASFDLIWAEGSAYCIGFENALRTWRPLARERGYLAATEITWLRPDPAEEVRAFFAAEYPAMQDVDANLAAVQRAGWRVVGDFPLPASAWWDAYYTPLERRLVEVRRAYPDDAVAAEVIASHEREIEMYRRYAEHYGYVFYVMEKA